MPNVSIGSTSYNVTVGYSPSLKVVREANSLVGPQGPSLTIYDNYPTVVGVVTSIDFGTNLTVTSISSGIVTVNSTASGGSQWVTTDVGIHTLSNVGIGTTAKNDFKLYVDGNAKITGILTVGNQSVTIDGQNNIIRVGSGVTIDGNTGIVSASSVYVNGVQVSTFSGSYNDLTNKPDLSSLSVAYASTAGVATALQNSRTFEITGDIIASPISFDGTGNVSLAATIQPNSVTLGDDTTGDYVTSITNGNYITGGDGGSEGASLTIGVAATSANTADQVVARDSSGNFSAGSINANLIGTATTSTNLSDAANITTGTISSSRLSGTYNIDISGNASSAGYASTAGVATSLKNSRTFEITGDIIASPISFDGTGNVSLAATIQPNSVALGNDTTGNYVTSITNGSYITGGDGGSESAVLTIGVAATSSNTVNQIVARDSSGNFSAGTITANLVGTASTASFATTAYNLTDAANITTGTINSSRLSGTYNIDISGNASSAGYASTSGIATALQNSRTFEITGDIVASPISFDGTGNVSLAATIQPNSVALGNDTTGNYVTSISNGSYITGADGGSEGSALTIGVAATSLNTVNQIVARDSSGNFSAGTITANLTGTASTASFATTAYNLTDAANITTGTINSSRLSGTYNIDISGNAATSGVANALQNSRTFEITGDVVASPIAFDGTGNVSLAATIQPNSVGLGTDTFGDYVKSISGTANQITVTSGTGEGSSPTLSIPNQFTAPQDIEVTRDLQVNRNLNVNGNITIGGTSATLFTSELKVSDPDLVLGFRTDALGNDVSTDNTANHGGIAVASTEGNPLVHLFIAGIETTPATYKKIMWFKAGEFSGLGTDAWLSNYAIGIGSTQFPSGTRLAAGGMQVTDSTLSVPQLNISGVTTSTGGFVGDLTGNAISATYATTAGVSTSVIGGIGSITQLRVSGVSTLGITTFTGAVSFGTSAYFGTNDNLVLGNSNNLQIYYNGSNSLIDATNGPIIIKGTTISHTSDAHIFKNEDDTRTFASFLASGIAFYYNNNNRLEVIGAGITVTGTTFTNQLSVSGVTTSTGGFVGNLTGTATTAINLADAANITTGTINSARLSGNYNIDVSYASTSGIATVAQGLTGTPNITVGVVTATSFVKSGGTSSQFLKADGSVDTSTYLTTTGSGSNLTGIVTSIVAGTNVTISGSTGQVTINGSGGVNYWNQTTAGIHTLSNVGIGTTNPTEPGLSVLGKIQILQQADSTSRLIFRAKPGNFYRWNIDNDSSELFRIFSEDDATSANGAVRLSISTTGTVTAAKFSGDGSLLTGITASGSGVVVQNQGSNVGTAGTLNFSTNLTASFASGTATISLSNNPSITGILTVDQLYTSNNGNGTNIRIGDDLWLGDINVANTTRFSGAQDSTKAFVVFGSSDAVALGRTGTGPLYYGGNFNVAGVSSATSFMGSGTNLTGIVTSIVAGTNITVSGSTGQVTINSTATGGGGASLDILEVMLFS